MKGGEIGNIVVRTGSSRLKKCRSRSHGRQFWTFSFSLEGWCASLGEKDKRQRLPT